MAKEKAKAEEVIEAAPEAPVTQATISLSDIKGVIQIIDVVTKRGAFNGDEMADVGRIRNSLATFLVQATPDVAETSAE